LRPSALTAALAACLALALGGCGGDDSDSASTAQGTGEAATASSPQQPAGESTQARPQAGAGGKQGGKSPGAREEGTGKQGSKGPSSVKGGSPHKQGSGAPKPHLKLVRIPPISRAPVAGSKSPAPGVKTVKGADNSVQEYGTEATSQERREAAIAVQAYLNARAEEDWGRACSYLAQRPKEQLERLQDAASRQGKDLGGCAGTMAFLREGAAQLREQAKIAEVLSFRGGGDVSGDPSYLIFTAPPGPTLYSMPVYLEGGTWKAGLARPSELPAR